MTCASVGDKRKRTRCPMAATGGGGVSQVLRAEMASASPEWLRDRWRDVSSAIRTGDVMAVVDALRVIYDIAPEETLVDMANRYIGGSR